MRPECTSGSLTKQPGLPDVAETEEHLPVAPAKRRVPLRCFLGIHDHGDSGVGYCKRGCGHYVLSRMLGGGGWIKHTSRPTGPPPLGPPPRNAPSPPPPGPPEPPRPPLHRPVS